MQEEDKKGFHFRVHNRKCGDGFGQLAVSDLGDGSTKLNWQRPNL